MRFLLVFVFIALGGCIADQNQQMGQCRIEALRKYSGQGEENSLRVKDYLQFCMEAHGYDYATNLDVSDRCMERGLGGVRGNPYCYEPNTWLGKQTYKLELRLDNLGRKIRD
jgi:hypothetical protein